MKSTSLFSEEEITRLADTEFFPAKARISAKIRSFLEALHGVYAAELANQDLLAPEGFDRKAVQLVKGEHLEDFPYQYLDFPRFFTRKDKFAFRTLFWWGHHVAFAVMLEGSNLRAYKQNLINRFGTIADRRICLCLSPSLWEWKEGPGYTLELTRERRSQLAAVLADRPHLKVARFLPLNDPLIANGEVVRIGQDIFRPLLSIITHSR